MTPAQVYSVVRSRLRRSPAAARAARLLRAIGLRRGSDQPAGATDLLVSANRLAAQYRHEEALREIARCLRLAPGNIQVLLTKIQIEAYLQRYDDALDSCLLVLALDPACKQLRPSLGVILANPALAHRIDEVLRRLDPHDQDPSEAAGRRAIAAELMPALVRRADELLAAGAIAPAAQLLQRCRAMVPDSAPVLLGLVRLRVKQGQLADALDLCLDALDADPASDTAVAGLAEILQRMRSPHRLEDAGKALARHLAARPDGVQGIACLMHWVDALVRADGVRAASDAVARALASVPDADRIRGRIVHLLAVPERADGNSSDGAARPPKLAGAQTVLVAPSDAEQDAYDRLVALNVVDTIGRIARRFYRDLGYDARSAPLAVFLAEARAHLDSPSLAGAGGSAWPLLRFEAAWNLYLNGEREKSIRLLRTVADDPSLARVAKVDPFAKEALIRSGEIVGRHDERAGSAEKAISVYQRTMQLEENGVVARRMALLRWRKGDLRGALEAADSAVMTKQNLFPRLPEGPYMSWLRRQLAERGRGGRDMPKPSMSAG